jgi:uncharacterized Ntn-hydrolase superfamily protein
MTFSIIGRCTESGMFGVAITTSSISVGSRCPHARAGVGAVATQNITDPALGPALLDQLELGIGASQALDNVLDGLPNARFRQLTVIDRHGTTACHTGENILGIHALSAGNDCFAAGNLLSSDIVPGAMTSSFQNHGQLHLAPRLLKALQAGLDAGGEQGDVHSAALLVVDAQPFPLVDLRVDWDDNDPVLRLKSLWHNYEPQMQDYLIRAIDPDKAPSYGVPGDF